MRTIKDPKKKPEVRRRTDLDEEEDDARSTKSTPPKKRKATKSKDDSSSSLNDSGSFADNQSEILSERSSIIAEDDTSDVSSLKSTPPKKRGYHKLANKCPEVNGDLNTEPEQEPEKKLKTRKPLKKEEKSDTATESVNPGKSGAKRNASEKKSPKGKTKSAKTNDNDVNNEIKPVKPVVDGKTKRTSTPSRKPEQKSKIDENQIADDVESSKKSTSKRKRKLSGPAVEDISVKDKRSKNKKEKTENEGNENDSVTPTKSKPKQERKSKKQILKEQAQLELKRQTEELRNSHTEKLGVNSSNLDTESKSSESAAAPQKTSTPKKRSNKNENKKTDIKERTDSVPEISKHCVNNIDQSSGTNIVDNATKSIEEVSKADYVLSIPDHLRSDGEMEDEDEENLSDLDTSFDSLNSEQTKSESVVEKNQSINSVNSNSKAGDAEETDTTTENVQSNSVNGKPEINIKCDNCTFVFKSKGGYTRHLRKCQPDKIGQEGSGQGKVVKLHRCEQCEYSAPRRVLVINHMKVHGIFQCKRCTYRTDNEEDLDDHSGQEHKDRSDCKFCKQCNRYVKCSEIPLEKHMEECQGRVPFKCPECTKEFQYESSLKCHVVSHYPDQPKLFSCDQCDYKSNYKANLKKHVRHIHEQRGTKSIKCPDCEKCFHTEDNMRRHQKLHSTERPHKCDHEDCDKAFKTMNGLKLHMVSHQTERPYVCEVEGCTKGFKTNYALGKHLNEVHENAPKTFKCHEENCTMAFYKKYHLERHVEAHKDNRSFFCTWPSCTKAFKKEENMKAHLLIHTDEKPLKCEHCDYTCRQKSSVKFHMRKKHPELVPPSDLKSPKPSKKGSKISDTPANTDSVISDHEDENENDVAENDKNSEDISISELTEQDSLKTEISKTEEIVRQNGNIPTDQNSTHNKTHQKDGPIQNHSLFSKDIVPSDQKEERTSINNQKKPDLFSEVKMTDNSLSTATNEVKVKKPKKTDMYEFQSEEESEDEMKPGLLRKGYDKDKPPLPSVTGTIDPSILSDLNIPLKEENEEKEQKPQKVKKKPGPKPKPKPEKPEVKPKTPEVKPKTPEVKTKTKPEKPEVKPKTPEVKPETPEPEPEVKQPKKRGRKKKSEIEKEKEKEKEIEKEKKEKEQAQAKAKATKPKGKRGRSPKAKKEEPKKKESIAEEEEEAVPVKKKRGPKKKVKEEKVVEKVPKKRGRKKKVVKEAEKKKEIEPENGDATINYSEVESSELFADSKDSMFEQTPDAKQEEKTLDSTERPVSETEESENKKDIDGNDCFNNEKENDVSEHKDMEEKDSEDKDNIDRDDLENNVREDLDRNDKEDIDNNDQTANVENEEAEDADDKKSSDLNSDSSDIGSDFDEDLKPPPAPRPPPMYDSEDGDIESGPENEDFNGSAMSNEPLRDFESSRDISKEISRDFESSRELNDSVKTNEVHSVETSTPKEMVGTPSSVNPLRNDSVGNDYDNQETPYPQSHHSSVSHTPSHNSIPPTPATSQEFESHGIENQVGERMIKNQVQGQANDENTDESSMPEVDKDYVGRFFEEIQCTQTQSEGQINRMNSIEESSKSQEKIVETSQSDSGVPSSLTSNQTDSNLQMQSPPADLSMKRMDILSTDRSSDDHYQPRSVGSDHRSSDRISSVPPFEAQFNPLDPYSPALPPRDSILRQTEKVQSPTNAASSFMRFPESEAMLQRQRMTTPYDRNIQNLHRITDPTIPQHNSSSPLLQHVPGREDIFPTAAGVTGTMPRNPFHSSWPGQDVRPAHWGHPTYLQRPLDQQSGSSSTSLFGKDSYLPGRDFMFDPSRAAAERNMFSTLASSHTQRPDIAHDTFQFNRFDIGSYLSSHGYNTAPSLPVDYTRSAAGSTQKTLDERYRQSSTGVSDYRSLPQTSSSDMFGMNSSFNLDKFYPRDPMYHSQHITDNTNSRFLSGVAAQHSVFGRDYAHPSFYTQNTPYPFVNMNDKNYTAATAKLASSGSVGQQRELVPVPRPNMSAPDPQLQDPYRHHSSMLYNMMNRYFD